MINPVIGSTVFFSNTKPSRSYQRQAFSFSRTQRSWISSGRCCRVKASSCRPRPFRWYSGATNSWSRWSAADAAPASRRARPPSSATNRLQPFSISRSNAGAQIAPAGNCWPASSPVETQLSIQTRATSSYSSTGGRMRGELSVIAASRNISQTKRGALARPPLYHDL